jgi:hypothetical protein
MGGGSSQQPTNTTTQVNNSSLPAYAQPYYEDLMSRAQGASNTPYTPYDAQRIAGFNPNQVANQNATLGMQAPAALGQASGMAQQAGLGALNAGANYHPEQINAQQLQQYQMAAPQQWGSQQAQNLMSPYAQNVMDVQKQQALRDAQQGQLAQNLGAARQGTYGGARQLLATTERERNLGQQLGGIEATGLQNAYTNAQQQFNTQQSLAQNTGAQNLQARLGVQQLGAGQNMQAQLANQQGYQFGADLGLRGLAQANQSAQTLSNLGMNQQQADLSRLQAQSAVAGQQQNLTQQQMDQKYQDFLTQRDYPEQQLSYYSSIMHGVPVGNNTTTTTSTPAPSALSQMAGLGLGGLGLYKLSQG